MCTLVRVGRRWPGAPPALSYDALARSEPLGGFAARAPEDELFIVFTSGTTDLPKAVVHSSRSIGATVELAREHLALRRGDVVYSKELHLVLPALLAGAHAVLPRHGRFSPARVLRDLERFGATHTFGLSTEYLELADHCARHGRRLPEALRQILLGGAPIHGAMLERLQPVLAPSTAAWCVYGMTEMLPVARVSLGEKLAYSGAGDLVGTPFPGVSVSLADDGELLVRGPNQCTGYLDKRRDGGHPTGDLARIDGSGRVVLLGRKKDMVIRGDLNIYPALIEPVIDRIEGVRPEQRGRPLLGAQRRRDRRRRGGAGAGGGRARAGAARAPRAAGRPPRDRAGGSARSHRRDGAAGARTSRKVDKTALRAALEKRLS